MKMRRSIVLFAAVLAMLGAAPGADVRVPQSQIARENARWSALGVKLPPGGIVLEHPYAAPYTNRSFVVPYAWYRSFDRAIHGKPPFRVQASALRADLPILRLLAQKTYAGWDSAEQRGWNWNRMFAAWNARLARRGKASLPLQAAFAPWAALQGVVRDNHSGVVGYTRDRSGSASAVLAQNPGSSCAVLRFANGSHLKLDVHDAATQPHAVQSWDGMSLLSAWYVSYPRNAGAAKSILCGKREIALSAVPQNTALSPAPVYTWLGDGIAYLRLPTFTDANNDTLHTVLSHAPQLGKERLVIFDLRGNTGGHLPSDLLTNWFAESAVEIAGSLAQTGSTSCFATALSFGAQQQLAAHLKTPVSSGLQQALQDIVDTLRPSPGADCTVQPEIKTSDHPLRDHRFELHPAEKGQTRVVAVVDGSCAGDCEYLTYLLAGLPNTVIAGASTFGVMGFGRPGYFVLPHSRVAFRLALNRNDPYGDGRSVDGYGLSVDVLLPNAASQSAQSLNALAHKLVE